MSRAASAERGKDPGDFYDRLRDNHLSPVWKFINDVAPPQPQSPCVPAHWRYSKCRELMFEASELLTTEGEARRVLLLENPGLPGIGFVTNTLTVGLQLVLPGEVAPNHRHSQSAMRFIIEGPGALTTVNGNRVTMVPGDLILTPGWAWHDHANESNEPMAWMDGLDVPIVKMFDAGFMEQADERQQKPSVLDDGDFRFGANLMPLDVTDNRAPSLLIQYPYDKARAALDGLKNLSNWDPCHGIRMRYSDPTTCGWTLRTIGPAIQLVPSGFATVPYRSTDATIFLVTEGSGSAVIGSRTFDLQPRDIFVVPSWISRTFEAGKDGDLVLQMISDRPAQELLGFWREDRSVSVHPRKEG